jgi:hypothetical protein
VENYHFGLKKKAVVQPLKLDSGFNRLRLNRGMHGVVVHP